MASVAFKSSEAVRSGFCVLRASRVKGDTKVENADDRLLRAEKEIAELRRLVEGLIAVALKTSPIDYLDGSGWVPTRIVPPASYLESPPVDE